ncbi:uncharacterized protein Bfra_006358 [Botrytis fragariae]|uniref:Uncharacterized protein n=1 Tax=Botrytis fragariae TaxID=1964551 RepID=A0A8H6B4M7_9HELO|nr:uncharacterized protein Bfra_006358 [Botrytis fragariae]KAF5879154.1 hypothetical protein Bfra_006358 [Botrytis fragariae]
MPPNPRIDNNTLVWNAISKQLDIADEFRGIWNKLDHDRLIADVGVANKNAAHHRFRRWSSSMAEQSGQSSPDNEEMGEAVSHDESLARGRKRGVKLSLKNAIKAEENVPVLNKKVAGKEVATETARVSLDTNEDDEEEDN